MNISGSFGRWLKQRRKVLDLTQAELADQVGCTITTIQKIEADLRRPSKQITEQLADILFIGVSMVKKHINHIYDKLDAKNRTQAVAFARNLNLLN